MIEIAPRSKTDHEYHLLRFKYANLNALTNKDLDICYGKVATNKSYLSNRFTFTPKDLPLVNEVVQERVIQETDRLFNKTKLPTKEGELIYL
ncbi:MAG: hypothetical protein Unbinned5081contig1002_22 [Prokaryotic dsDNA virus sp.]|nr:MAG: hypothetical protein Unbinned5081contig1002_22 [Prokaryotic dsDNA virus sp.]|tara:strand:- start:1861 stop:2136 length:276 start_codon:yes stop_codon:yes gene_type:complete